MLTWLLSKSTSGDEVASNGIVSLAIVRSKALFDRTIPMIDNCKRDISIASHQSCDILCVVHMNWVFVKAAK